MPQVSAVTTLEFIILAQRSICPAIVSPIDSIYSFWREKSFGTHMHDDPLVQFSELELPRVPFPEH